MLLAVRYGRVLAWIAFVILLPILLGSVLAQIGLVLGVVLDAAAVLWVWLWLPRSAHGAFLAGSHRRAVRRYRTIAAVTRSTERERAARLSRLGCHVAAGELAAADRVLAGLDGAGLDAQERAVWLNNRACIALARGDAHAALALADEATGLRPDVPALQHTRGTALLAVGRVDDAIAVLDRMRHGGELGPRLEAERCQGLAQAWTSKGEPAYAEDYRLRADALAR
jgi:predicted Zn-dependent protease